MIKVETPLHITTTEEDVRYLERAFRRRNRAKVAGAFVVGATVGLLVAGATVPVLGVCGFMSGWVLADVFRGRR